MKFTPAVAGLVMAILLAVIPAMADPVTSLPGGTIVAMPASYYFGPGPQVFGPAITWSSTNAASQGGSVFGYAGGYGFLGNGSWTGSLGPMAGLNDGYYAFGVTDTMTFALSTPVAGVGGFLNYVPSGTTPTVIAIYDSGMNLLESYSLTFVTGGGNDTGEFHGFLRTSPDISYFTLSDNYIGITDLTITGSYTPTPAIPEPTSVLLLGTGLGALGLAAWRRKR
jgi:hypothetical protein